ncbi:hypothetical protein DFJ73DRAFT_581021 [Zopfochytrium polystomum]|nr:hypothetical protein DFJ73DRAFT_581021 [Zopfochytrium polystomum]
MAAAAAGVGTHHAAAAVAVATSVVSPFHRLPHPLTDSSANVLVVGDPSPARAALVRALLLLPRGATSTASTTTSTTTTAAAAAAAGGLSCCVQSALPVSPPVSSSSSSDRRRTDKANRRRGVDSMSDDDDDDDVEDDTSYDDEDDDDDDELDPAAAADGDAAVVADGHACGDALMSCHDVVALTVDPTRRASVVRMEDSIKMLAPEYFVGRLCVVAVRNDKRDTSTHHFWTAVDELKQNLSRVADIPVVVVSAEDSATQTAAAKEIGRMARVGAGLVAGLGSAVLHFLL